MSEKPQQPQKQKTYTEDELNKKIADAVRAARASVFTYEISHKLDHYGHKVAPEFIIKMSGGDLTKVHELAIEIEQKLIEFSRANPPQQLAEVSNA